MSQATAQNNPRRCPFDSGRVKARSSLGKRVAKALIGLWLVIFTLLNFAACGSSSSARSASARPVTPNPYPPHQGALALNDPLINNNLGYKWDTRSDSCRFAKDGYHASVAVQLYSFFCTAYATNFSNFAYEAQMIILKGDSGGLFWRGDANNAKFYYFRIDSTGYFMFIIFTGHTGASLAKDGTTSAFHKGLGKSNLIGVVAQGDSFALYVNHQQVTTITDRTYSHGEIGVVASDYHSPVDVVFTDARIWKL
jgi:hypothetical protein